VGPWGSIVVKALCY